MKPLTTGTTTVGLIAGDTVVLAADKRATAGYMIASRRVKKIIRVTDYAAITVAGLVADAQALADILSLEAKRYELETGVRMSIKSMATLLSTILFSYKWFPFLVQIIVGGYDTKPRLYTLDPFGGVTEELFTATGSGSPVAYGVLEEHYRSDMSVDEAIKLAVAAIKSAILRDSASGDGVDVAVISKEGIEEKFIPFSSLLAQ